MHTWKAALILFIMSVIVVTFGGILDKYKTARRTIKLFPSAIVCATAKTTSHFASCMCGTIFGENSQFTKLAQKGDYWVDEQMLPKFMIAMGGAFPKIAQRLAVRKELLPERLAIAFSSSFEQCKERSQTEVEKLLDSMNVSPNDLTLQGSKAIKAASIGQIYKAIVPYQTNPVIVKVLFPETKKDYLFDFAALKSFLVRYPVYFLNLLSKMGVWTMPFQLIYQNIIHAEDMVLNEFNLIKEAEITMKAKIAIKNVKTIETEFGNQYTIYDTDVPGIHENYTHQNILVQEYVNGISLHTALKQFIESGDSTNALKVS